MDLTDVTAGVDEVTPDEPVATRRTGVLRYFAFAWLALIVGLAGASIFVPALDPDASTLNILAPPGSAGLLGTDQLGRDILARLAHGARTSLQLALFTTALSAAIGLTLGMVAGYYRGRFDVMISGLADFVLAVPGLVLLLVLVTFRGPSLSILVVGLCILQFPAFTRLARATTLSESGKEYVVAARGLGATHRRIIVHDLMPNVLPAVITYALTAVAFVLVAEGSLSFLGFGVPPPAATWGGMIAGGRPSLSTKPHVVLIPSIVMFLTVLSLNIGGEHFSRARALWTN